MCGFFRSLFVNPAVNKLKSAYICRSHHEHGSNVLLQHQPQPEANVKWSRDPVQRCHRLHFSRCAVGRSVVGRQYEYELACATLYD